MFADKSYFDNNYQTTYDIYEKTKANYELYKEKHIDTLLVELDQNNTIVKREYSKRVNLQNIYNNKYDNSYLPIDVMGQITVYKNNPNPSNISSAQFWDYKNSIEKIITSREVSQWPSERNKEISILIDEHNENFQEKERIMSDEIQETNKIINEYNNYYKNNFRFYYLFWIDFKSKNIPQVISDLPVYYSPISK